MKICIISDVGSVHTIKWSRYFTSIGYEVSVISLRPGSIEGVKVYSFQEDHFNTKSDLQKLWYIAYTSQVKRFLHEIQPDVIHVHYVTSYGILGALSGFHPCVMVVWGTDIQEFPKKSPFHRKLVEFNLKKADAIWSPSHALAQLTQQYTDKKVDVTPFGVNTDDFKPIPHLKQSDEFIVGTVKGLEPRYGMEYLIRGFAMVQKKHNLDRFTLEIAGVGTIEGELKALCRELDVEDKVKFLGFINKQEVIEAFNRFQVAVFPSLEEGFGVAAVEAQACGTPAIVSNVGGLPESTLPGITSLLVEPKDAASIADAIEMLYFDEEKRKQMGIAGREYVLNHYDVRDNFAYAVGLNEALVKRFNKRNTL